MGWDFRGDFFRFWEAAKQHFSVTSKREGGLMAVNVSPKMSLSRCLLHLIFWDSNI